MIELTTRQKNALAKKKIYNPYQIRRYVPLRYIDNTRETGLDVNLKNEHAVVIGNMTECVLKRINTIGRKYISIKIIDRRTNKPVRVTVFGAAGLFRGYTTFLKQEVLVCGTLKHHPVYGFSMSNPDTLTPNIELNMKVVPVYHKIKNMSEKTWMSVVNHALADRETDTIPKEILEKEGLCGINEALSLAMYPKSKEDIKAASDRLLFDDLYYLAAKLTISKRHACRISYKIETPSVTDNIAASLPFRLTNGQKEAYKFVRSEFLHGSPFHALIQGDVGSGKSIVAFLSMLLVSSNGGQAILLAPTQILAEQHHHNLKKLVDGSGMSVALITSAASKDEYENINNGKIKLIVGTHSLLSDKLQFKNPVLLVIDEEHKFGVSQRECIQNRYGNINTISMSATPIPRTLAVALYGNDIEILDIKDKPVGRKDVITYYDNGSKVVGFVKKILKTGHQVYAVCPMIEEAEENGPMDGVTSTQKALQIYKKYLPEYNIAELTGQTPTKETEKILSDFKDGKIHMLISTTVVEVGVDVPNATLMVIHDADRFGLAGLHQLRGRVGRSDEQSYCILVSKTSPADNPRLMTICNTVDGFEIAKQDLLFLRRSGNIFGEEQSGRNRYIDEMVAHEDVYKRAREAAEKQNDDILNSHIQKTMLVDFRPE